MIDAIERWGISIGKVYTEMIKPIVQGFESNNDKLVARELQYYLNCNTCSELVMYLRKSPNDKLLVDALTTSVMNVCFEFSNAKTCNKLATQFKPILAASLLNLLITEDYICSYLMPLCSDDDDNMAYEKIDLHSFVNMMISEKPASIQDDNFLDNLYL